MPDSVSLTNVSVGGKYPRAYNIAVTYTNTGAAGTLECTCGHVNPNVQNVAANSSGTLQFAAGHTTDHLMATVTAKLNVGGVVTAQDAVANVEFSGAPNNGGGMG
jgi:hypothetical protein